MTTFEESFLHYCRAAGYFQQAGVPWEHEVEQWAHNLLLVAREQLKKDGEI